jgi:3-deoxy-D-manno-octulosonate 8-phosphate phosphatase KdsC-like HAD superfamily phosphatase
MPAFKIASGDLTNTPLLRYVAALGRPMFLSTGGGTLEDVERAVDTILALNEQLCVMQCTAAYPCEVEELNLGVIETYRERFPELVVGLSDHQSGIAMSIVGYMLGARVIEKHFTLNHAWKGSDHAFSLMPEGMRRLVRDLHRVPDALGDGVKRPLASEERPLEKMGKQLVATRDLPAGAQARARRPRREVARGRRPATVRARRPAREKARASARVRAGRRAGRRRAGRAARRRPRSVTSLAEIELVVFDFDGVFTDNRVWTNEHGEESVACWRGDALGLRRLEDVGVDHFVLSMEVNAAVGARARKISAACIQGVGRQAAGPPRGGREARASPSSGPPYVGNDVNDVGCLEIVGLPVVPADAWPDVVPLAGIVLERPGRLRLRSRVLRRGLEREAGRRRVSPEGDVRIVGSVLVRNEDVHIERAIRNAADACDRIHVLDHLSNDRTPEILAALSAELEHVEVRRSADAGDSHRDLEQYVGTPDLGARRRRRLSVRPGRAPAPAGRPARRSAQRGVPRAWPRPATATGSTQLAGRPRASWRHRHGGSCSSSTSPRSSRGQDARSASMGGRRCFGPATTGSGWTT